MWHTVSRAELRTRSTFGASYFPSLAHISTLLGGATRSAPEQPATPAAASGSASDTAHASNHAVRHTPLSCHLCLDADVIALN